MSLPLNRLGILWFNVTERDTREISLLEHLKFVGLQSGLKVAFLRPFSRMEMWLSMEANALSPNRVIFTRMSVYHPFVLCPLLGVFV